eukprot:TRINITY_DN2452_c0_g1_i14.p1 TRINITY_DN2452_c0_g1~~TRINITY_DN2452_c0_g1_i14.p1  ORF type:complete len:257 (+),score=10.77 TRINITY_DN2452_c0_g1_i14:55-771(+)
MRAFAFATADLCVAATLCDERLSGTGNDYRGCQQVTASGKLCQNWASEHPHTHLVPTYFPGFDFTSNFCRQPDPAPNWAHTIWCLTTDPGARFEFCDPLPTPAPTPSPSPSPTLPTAATHCDERLSGNGYDYRGCQQVTVSGKLCQNWASEYPHTHLAPTYRPDVDWTSNFCRQADPAPNWAHTIWCLTTDPGARFEFCDPLPTPAPTPSPLTNAIADASTNTLTIAIANAADSRDTL